jgi:hypothetical protein
MLGLLRLDALSVQTALDGSRPIVWMINRIRQKSDAKASGRVEDHIER